MAQGNIEIQRSFPERLGQVAVVLGTVEAADKGLNQYSSTRTREYLLVIQLKADPQNRVPDVVLSLPHIKQGLAKVAAQVQIRPDVEAVCNVISAMVEPLAEFPAALPSFFVGVWCSGAVEDSFPVDRAEVGEGIAERPAFFQSCRKSPNLGFLDAVYMDSKIVNFVIFVSVGLWYHYG